MYSVTQWVTDWLALKRLEIKPRTMESYKDLVMRYVIPAIGDYDVCKLPPLAINALLARIVAEGHGRTAEMVYVLLRSALADVEPSSPMRRVKRPRHTQRMPEPWSDMDMQRYVNALDGHPHEVPLLLGIMMGLRRGEICGLRWGDIDLDDGLLQVINQRQPIRGRGVVDCPPKTSSSIRLLPIPSELQALLRSCAQPSGYVCTISPSGLDSAHRRLTRSLGLPYIPLHGLRHCCATAIIRHGGDMRSVQSILGHASYATTADRYTHPDIPMLTHALDNVRLSVIHSVKPNAPDS